MKVELSLPQEIIDKLKADLREEVLEEVLKEMKAKPSPKVEDDVIFDRKGLAKYLSVSKSWIEKRRMEIPCNRTSGKYTYRKKDIDKWWSQSNVPERQLPLPDIGTDGGLTP